jgi:hypothetical protein
MSQRERRSSLRDVQRAFAVALHGDQLASDDAACFTGPEVVPVTDRLAVYRNNAWQFFLAALGATYPVCKRRVGDDYFRQLARDYRQAYPSRHGDLHWVGEAFPGWLAQHLASTDYAWLADLARLEWACEQALVSDEEPSLALSALAALDPNALESVRLGFQPSLQFVPSAFPIWTVWQANQGDVEAAPVDLATGGESCVVACVDAAVAVYRLADREFNLLRALQDRTELGAAVVKIGLDAEQVTQLLRWAFAERLVTDLSPSARA